MKKKQKTKPVPVWVRREQTKLGLWMPAKLLKRLYHLADIKCRTKTAELITAIESHLERENYNVRSNIGRTVDETAFGGDRGSARTRVNISARRERRAL